MREEAGKWETNVRKSESVDSLASSQHGSLLQSHPGNL
jgi:hypothetical protein